MTAQFWPDEIDISDGKDVVQPDWRKFSTLSKYWDKAEKRTESESEFIKLMVWAIFCGLHRKAIEGFVNGQAKIRLEDLEPEYVKHKFEESLFDSEYDSYADLRNRYIAEK